MWRLIVLAGVIVVALAVAGALQFDSLRVGLVTNALSNMRETTESSARVEAAAGPSDKVLRPRDDRVARLSLADRITRGAEDIDGTDAFRPDLFSRNRIIAFRARFNVEDFLNEGETPPAPNRELLYFDARAAKIAAEQCHVIVEHFAVKCRVVEVAASRDRRGDLPFKLSATLAYIPNYDLGEINRKEGDLVEASIRLTAPGGVQAGRPIAPEYLERTLEICDHLRATFGNCVVTKLNFAEQRAVGGDPDASRGAHMRIDASFAVHGIWPKASVAKLEDALALFEVEE
ncbi:MAG: hypothetical protein AAF367_02085 [Pseudomonadota bacterium]